VLFVKAENAVPAGVLREEDDQHVEGCDGKKWQAGGPTEEPVPGRRLLLAAAARKYPKLANAADQWHHIWPKYLGGAADGELAKLPAAYHQLITNLFRKKFPYGLPRPSPEIVEPILKKIYDKLPVSPFI